MLQALKVTTLAAMLLLAAAMPGMAADAVTADDMAKFLAGMQPSADSPLAPLTRDPAWQRHARFFDHAFAQLEQRQLSKIRAWSDTQLAAPRPTMPHRTPSRSAACSSCGTKSWCVSTGTSRAGPPPSPPC